MVMNLLLSLFLAQFPSIAGPLPAPTGPLPGDYSVVLMSVASNFVDTQDPVISKITYGASILAADAQLSLTATNFEFRITASDNTGIAYATLEVLNNMTEGHFVAFVLPTDGPLPSTFWMVWNQKLTTGNYVLRLRVFDPSQHMAEKIFTVKK